MLQSNAKVWRYMSFAKFAWMIQRKQLWLTSVELLDDKWEVMPDSQQLNTNISKWQSSLSAEEAIAKASKLVKDLRKQTYVNCWNAADHESYALWRIFCSSSEGVVIQTTLDRLRKSLAGSSLQVVEVQYGPYEVDIEQEPVKLVARKRPMFAYEQEVRIVEVGDYSDPDHLDRITYGLELNWDPELHIENIYLHPDAQHWFMETVMQTVRLLAPKLSSQVWGSQMSIRPPF